jgi:hypothetical protein
MDQNYLIDFFAEIFPFGKRSKVQDIHIERPVHSSISTGMTGVSRYLSAMPKVTGVTKYLQQFPEPTGVEKYLKQNDRLPATGVNKYLVKKAISDKDKPLVSGVSKYVEKKEKTDAPSSSVSKYLAKQALTQKVTLSGVQKYLLNQERLLKASEQLTGVAKYELEKEKLEKKNAAQILIDMYKEKEAKSARDAAQAAELKALIGEQESTEQAIEEPSAATGVGRYIQLKKSKPAPSGVAKYIAGQIIRERQKPSLSSVSKYLAKQKVVIKPEIRLSTVEKYLQSKADLPRVKKEVTGVSKYLATQAILTKAKPPVSGVTKYLNNQAQLEKQNPSLGKKIKRAEVVAISIEKTGVEKYLEQRLANAKETIAVTITGVEKYLEQQAKNAKVALEHLAERCLEGEFIPASEVVDEEAVESVEAETETTIQLRTGVSKYLDRQVPVLKEVVELKLTGVERYLEQQIEKNKKLNLTGVEKYLLEKA